MEKTIEQLQEELKVAQATIAEQTTANKELLDINADMQEQLEVAAAETETAKAAAPQKVVAKVGQKEYEVVTGCRLPGARKFTAEEIADNEDVVTAILKIKGQNILKAL